MSNYLLLRDNKQSGPYSMEELRSKGLKPYDLVWIDGKSAAWRYPSEVEELKPFAPVVEEQPFDRFYKKPSQASPASNTSQTSNTSSSSNAVAEEPVASKGNFSPPIVTQPESVAASAATPGRRIIYVTMPGNVNKTAALAREPGLSENIRPPQAGQESAPSGRNSREEWNREEKVRDERITDEKSRDERAAAFSALQIPHHDVIEENFSQEAHLDDHRFVEKRPQHNRPSAGRMMRPLALTLGVIALLAAGVFIGLSINGHIRGLDRSSVSREELTPDRVLDHPNPAVPVYTTSVSNPIQKTGNTANGSLPGSAISGLVQSPNAKTGREEGSRKKMTPSKEKLAASQLQKAANDAAASAKDSALALLVQPHREASHRTDESLDKEAIKNNVIDQVSVSANKYNTGTFGGISELQLTVSNRSIYPLDLVVVEVKYIQANKKVYKAENLYFRGIGAGAALMQEAPRSSRGIKVQYRIILINSKELGLSYSGI